MSGETETGTAFQRVAVEFASCFESAVRPGEGDENDRRFVRVRDGSPDWVTDLVYEAHGDMLPDNWRYACIAAAAEAIAECEDESEAEDRGGEFADDYVDAYTSRLLEWAASHSSRLGYCDDAVSSFGLDAERGGSLIDTLLRMGQYAEAEEVFGLVLAGIVERAGFVDGDGAGA